MDEKQSQTGGQLYHLAVVLYSTDTSNNLLWRAWLGCTDTHSTEVALTCGIFSVLGLPGVSYHKALQACLNSPKSASLYPTSNWETPSSCLNNHPAPLFCSPLPSSRSVKLAFGILKLNLFKNKQLGACISQTRVTDHTRRPKT